MIRKRYRCVSWDPEKGEGVATDGTNWQGEPVPFHISATNLNNESLDGHLEVGETFSAEEDVYQTLHNVVIEDGKRAIIGGYQSKRTDTELNSDGAEALIEKIRTPEGQIAYFQPPPVRRSVEDRLSEIEARVAKLESQKV